MNVSRDQRDSRTVAELHRDFLRLMAANGDERAKAALAAVEKNT